MCEGGLLRRGGTSRDERVVKEKREEQARLKEEVKGRFRR